MKTIIKVALGAALGFVAGALATKKYYSDIYQKFADEQIADVKAHFTVPRDAKPQPPIEDEVVIEEHVVRQATPEEASYINQHKGDIRDYTKYFDLANGYARGSEEAEKAHEEKVAHEQDRLLDEVTHTEIVHPDDFGTVYDTMSLTLYADGVLEDDQSGEIVEHPELMIGDRWKDHIGDYEDDICFVRNHEDQTDYEIVCDPRPYSEVFGDAHKWAMGG